MKTKLPLLALVALLFAGLPLASSSAAIGISVAIAPPAIPVYEQPYCPAPGYIWTPGYWEYADFGYYWVPGAWVRPPRIGLLWTPGYWGYRGGRYVFNNGYWGPTVGFYGGINYGYGYGGRGYYGGQWAGNTFRYNTAVTRVNTSVIHNTYVNREVVKNTGTRAGFNGPGGANAKPTAQEQKAAQAKHLPPTTAQRSRVKAAQSDPGLRAASNKGQPKPEAVQAFRNKNGAKPGKAAAENNAAAGNQAGNKKQKGLNEQTSANNQANKKRKATAAHANEGRQARSGQASSAQKNRSHQAAGANQNHPMRKTASHANAAERTRAAQHRPQTRQAHKANNGSAQGKARPEQNPKKKKRPHQGPGGQ